MPLTITGSFCLMAIIGSHDSLDSVADPEFIKGRHPNIRGPDRKITKMY